MEHWWKETGKSISKSAKENLSLCYFVHQKSHMNCPGIHPFVSPFIGLWLALRRGRYFTVPCLSISVSFTVKEKVVLPNCNKLDR
jgi:hypothetical protein